MNRRALSAALVAVVATTAAVGVFGAAGLAPGSDPATGTPADPTPAAQPIAHGGDAVTLANDPDQTVTGTTDLAAGSEVVVRLQSTNGSSPFIKSATATVDAEGSYETTFDLTGVEAGTEFTVVLRHDDAELANASGVVVSGTVDDTDAPDDGPSVLEYAGDAVTLQSATGQTVAGSTDLGAGAEVTIRLRSSGGAQPFIKSATVTVDEDGRFSATFDVSDVEPGTSFTVTVRHDDETLGEAPGEVAGSN